ncbi:MAG: PHP domain protein [Candidatus Uhrbacteria bacterium GW2011_GWF2_39_13]|uniref:DNA polymerase beta n=1 Tax=Candidatus Uhrbacteria bacterium GW2011_GWF2_39_13 TaxID=1618995 RepID=A0A0G0MUL5_9BACT|nr:MAG: PHP domain protein [Candidatus Uhrbacteria bacterium GW2011_GWF2_39_13]HAU65996.1 DNA polymerase/3'-5' exonuclease PolX [Candidatus Uhrbacteria bacterium]
MSPKKITNKEIIEIFREIALYLRAEDVAFKPQAYEVAAESLSSLQQELSDLYQTCGATYLDQIPGVGKSMIEKIEEIIVTGKLSFYVELKKKYPFDMMALSRIQNIGPKTAMKLYRELGVKTLRDLERAAKANKIADLPGMGKKTQDIIVRGIQYLKQDTGRRLIHDVLPFAEELIGKLKTVKGTTHVNIAGSLRRRKETIGDIDLLATSSKPEVLIKAFKNLPQVYEVLEEGSNKLMVRYINGLQGDLLILPPEEYGAALVHFTGSREHNIFLRERAINKKMKLSKHGLWKGSVRITSRTEKQVYKHLGLEWIAPELRVGSDEIEKAAKKQLPDLIEYGSLKGDLQIQTTWSDGIGSIEEMANAAKAYGLSYMAVTDHTHSLHIAQGLDEKRLKQQAEEIDVLNKKIKGFTILKSTECEILKDGKLDLSDTRLKTLDIVSVSVHGHIQMTKKDMTQRIIRALKHPLVNILFHPTGRVVTKREGYELDMDQIIKAAREYHVALEINGSARLDLHEHYIRQAIGEGVKLVISSDAHDSTHLEYLDYGIAQARKGWCTKADILNTKPLKKFLAALKKEK